MRYILIFLLMGTSLFIKTAPVNAATVHCDRFQTYSVMNMNSLVAKLRIGHSTRDEVAWAKIDYVVNAHEYAFDLCKDFRLMFETKPGLCEVFEHARDEVHSVNAELFAVREITQPKVIADALLLDQYALLLQGGFCSISEETEVEPPGSTS